MASNSPIPAAQKNGDAAEEQHGDGGPPGSGSKSKRSRILMVMLSIPLQAALAYLVIVFLVLPRIGTPEKPVSENEDNIPTGGVIYILENVIVNPADTHGTRYLNATVGLEVTDAKVMKQLEDRDVELRDLLIDIFGSKRLDELDGTDDREKLRAEIADRVSRLTDDQLIRVFISNFVLQ